VIELAGICRNFQLGDQQVRALADVDLHIGPGEYVSVMGPSGSGKSTLLNIIALLDRPSSGSYRLNATDITNFDDDALARTRRENIGFVFQFFHLIPRLTAFQNVEIPLILAGLPPAQRRERVAQALADLGLTDRAQHRPDQLSGGQRQRVAIARAGIMRPGILLADEPTGNLDSVSGRQVMDIIERMNREQGVTLIIVTHDADLGRRAARHVRLVDGRIARDAHA
jgi:putative ABC transport system ATP-binding protein